VLNIKNVVGGEDQEWAAVEMTADSVCKNGMIYDQTYAWIVRFNEQGLIVQTRAYVDTQLVKDVFESNT